MPASPCCNRMGSESLGRTVSMWFTQQTCSHIWTKLISGATCKRPFVYCARQGTFYRQLSTSTVMPVGQSSLTMPGAFKAWNVRYTCPGSLPPPNSLRTPTETGFENVQCHHQSPLVILTAAKPRHM
jgi:hypothetical protein